MRNLLDELVMYIPSDSFENDIKSSDVEIFNDLNQDNYRKLSQNTEEINDTLRLYYE